MATKTAQKKRVKPTRNTFKSKAIQLHDGVLRMTGEIVDETLATGGQWQNLLAKTLKKGTHLFGKQQDIVLTTLEMAKDQYDTGNKRLKRLFSFKPIGSNKSKAPTQKTSKTATKKTNVPKAKKAASVKKEAVPKNTVAKNDLKIIEGIGPKIEGLLNEAGIQNFEQLKSAKIADLKNILHKAGPRFQMHDPGTWGKQAGLAAAGKMEELKTLQNKLKGGK